MTQRRIVIVMPACAADVFEAFHNHTVRKQWDTLLAYAAVEGGGNHPYIGAITINVGRGWKRFLACVPASSIIDQQRLQRLCWWNQPVVSTGGPLQCGIETLILGPQSWFIRLTSNFALGGWGARSIHWLTGFSNGKRVTVLLR